MKKSNLSFLILSLPAAAVMFPYSSANAAVRVTNSSVMQHQIQQQNAAAYAAQQDAARYATQTPQPARTVTNNNGETVSVSSAQMDACNNIYPNGIFEWVRPTSGRMAGGPATCAAFVEMRAYNAAGTTYTVLANTYLAAGDNLKCNIDNFPNITLAGADFTYPADSAPTLAEVEKVMAEENKANAGFKILAATVVGGIGGNLLGKGKSGDDSPLSLGGDKVKTTLGGAALGAAVMTASTQVNDYKTGTMILSTATDAAAGAVAGNVMASGEEVLQIAKCKINDDENKTCLYGSITGVTSKDVETEACKKGYFYNLDEHNFIVCDSKCEEGSTEPKYWNNCHTVNITDVWFDSDQNTETDPKKWTDINKACRPESTEHKYDTCKNKALADTTYKKYGYEEKDVKDVTKRKIIEKNDTDDNRNYVLIASAKTAGARTSVLIEVPSQYNKNKLFGYKRTDWYDMKADFNNQPVYDAYGHPMDGKNFAAISSSFSPAYLSATDGDVVDFNNAARTKSTLIGAAGGAGLGALSGAAGADAAIQERLNTAIREYNDSLGSIACSTGGRYLSKYNDMIIIPEMQTAE